ncbi:MAG: tripartite tricarboxylate transporter TctB family protein [Deltaproteobacteria bacterium]|nr:tripartite tricarboxylate transporter TctB family protein [Deltaproteobacteria bacterium]
MKGRLVGSTWLTLVFVALVVVALFETRGLGSVAQLVPRAIAVPTLALIVFQLLLDLFPGLRERLQVIERRELVGVQAVREEVHPEHIVVREHPTPEDPGGARQGEASAFGWMAGMLGAAFLLGFTVGGPLFALAYIRFHGRRPWPVSLAVAIGLGLAIVGVFDWTFGAALWRGQLWQWLGV